MRVIFRFVARLLGATLVTTVVLISLTATAAAARAHEVLADGHVLHRPAVADVTVAGAPAKIFIESAVAEAPAEAPAPRLQPAVEAQPTPWTVVVWLAAGMVLVVAAGVMLTVVGRLRAARVGRSGTSR
jgi:hypothetical protein